jgi:hypothetical protein
MDRHLCCTPAVGMGVVWRRDDPGAVLNSFLEVVTEVFPHLKNG